MILYNSFVIILAEEMSQRVAFLIRALIYL